MKSAIQLAKEIQHGLMWSQLKYKAETNKDYLVSAIQQIQLDAIKEGMRRAALIVTHKHMRYESPTIEKAILKAIDKQQLTNNDTPTT